jgi:hypothetical protein
LERKKFSVFASATSSRKSVSDFDIIGLFLSFVLFAEGAAEFCQIASFKEMEETFDLTGATVVFAKIPISRKSKVEYKLLFLLFFLSFLF